MPSFMFYRINVLSHLILLIIRNEGKVQESVDF